VCLNCTVCRAKGQFCNVRQATVCWEAAMLITAAHTIVNAACCREKRVIILQYLKFYTFLLSCHVIAKVYCTVHCWSVLYSTLLKCIVQYIAEVYCTVQCWSLLYSTLLKFIVQYIAEVYCIVHCWSVLHSTLPKCIVQYIAEVYCTVHCWSVLYSTLLKCIV